jgi:hypothetical protein
LRPFRRLDPDDAKMLAPGATIHAGEGELMKRRLAMLLVAVIAVSAFGFTGVASAGAARTRVTIEGPNGDFQGTIESIRSCLGGRRVILFMSDSADGPFARTGNTDTSERQGSIGVWSMGNTGLRDAFFYAKAKKTDTCRGGRSPVIHVN